MAHVAELPGCFAVGSTAPLAVAALPGAITRFLQWLRAHREPLVPEAHVSRPSIVDISVAEVREGGAPFRAGSKAALFAFDQEAWDDYKLERTLRWLSYSRADLLAKVAGLDDAALTARRVAADRTLHDILWHVANAEFGYISQLVGNVEGKEPVTDDAPADVRERLTVVREIFTRHVLAVPPDKRGEIVYPSWGERPDEPWTLAKAVRRALEHEREHVGEVLGVRR
ncbi:MAG TPA: DinB family protein [Chloroflexia bacterium]|nr:DinB family protein [Chloroflexia bacterium]